MQEFVGDTRLPSGWRNYSLDELLRLVEELGVQFHFDDAEYRRQLRQAILAASHVDYDAPTTQLTPEEEARHEQALRMREAGIGWKQVANELEYPNREAAYTSVARYCKRMRRPFPYEEVVGVARQDPATVQKAVEALDMRLSGKAWREIAETMGYSNASGPYLLVRDHCARNGVKMPKFNAGPPPRTHCRNGHEMTPDNTFTRTNGVKECRTCRRSNKRQWKAKRRAMGLPYK